MRIFGKRSGQEELRLINAVKESDKIKEFKSSPHWTFLLKHIAEYSKELDRANLDNVRKGDIDPYAQSQNTMARIALEDFIDALNAIENKGDECRKILQKLSPKKEDK
ncbi:MAG: hypothetical protein UY18_C0018G0004 [Microgenomates group bacterium GW2011_GWF2_47_9]|nr:MAG: hypothetical protein UY18_C0018G0004 [Microgenomates group bacterium GW2011_GWF2_47_9]